MLTVGFPAQAFGTNCYVAAKAAGQDCVIIDPGIGVLPDLERVLTEHQLNPVAILLTHGHLDHTCSVPDVLAKYQIPTVIHQDDFYRLEDPITTLGPELRQMVQQSFGPDYQWVPPQDVRQLATGEAVSYAGLDFTVLFAPGHTEGSVMFHIRAVPQSLSIASSQKAELPTSTLFVGDVLFAGSIGRTDLPGGSMPVMQKSLRDVVLPIADDTLVLPGHGPATTIGHEKLSNPYLLEAARHG